MIMTRTILLLLLHLILRTQLNSFKTLTLGLNKMTLGLNKNLFRYKIKIN